MNMAKPVQKSDANEQELMELADREEKLRDKWVAFKKKWCDEKQAVFRRKSRVFVSKEDHGKLIPPTKKCYLCLLG